MPYQETPYQKVNIVDADGNIVSGSNSSSTTTGDASAENQLAQTEQITSISNSFGQTTDTPAEDTNDATWMSLAKGIFNKIYYYFNDESTYYQLESNAGSSVDIDTKNYARLILRFLNTYNGEDSQLNVILLDENDSPSFGAFGYPLGQSEKNSSQLNGKVIKSNSEYIAKTDYFDYGFGIDSKAPKIRVSWYGAPGGFPLSIIVRPLIENNATKTLEIINDNFGTSITGTILPAGGAGLQGWLSWIARLISDRVSFTNNTTTNTPLAASATYTSPAQQTANLNKVRGWIFANQSGTLFIEFSSNSTTWRVVQTISYTANNVTTFEQTLSGVYYRLRYVNGATAQTTFELLFTQMGFGA